jgi:Phosphoesterase family
MRSLGRFAVALALFAGTALTVLAASPAGATATAAAAPAVPRLDHVFLIMEENNGFGDVIGNKAAPNLNYLAKTFGLATDYYGVSPDSSESNYVGILGGSTFGVTSDDAYWKNTVDAPSLITQLDKAGISWKAYLQALPYPGYEGICYPAKCNGAPDSDPLYVAKHDAIQNFTPDWTAADRSRQVPIGQLSDDLRWNDVPQFSYIVPDECHDMHGDPPYCLDSGNIGDPQNQHLVSVGDAYLGQLVSGITHAKFWAQGNNAIIITYDNGDNSEGCCDASPGGGPVATVVVTSHGPRGVKDAQPANHYSTLATIQQALGLGCLQFTCDTKNVTPLSSLVAVTGSTAIATTVQPQLTWPIPTPSQPAEPLSYTKATPTEDGWTVQKTQLLGTSDNSVGAVAGSSPTDVWAVGDYLPDATGSNQDATLTFAEHYNGKKWTVVRTPNTGVNFNSFYGLAATGGEAWAVGEYLNAAYQDRALIEVWNGQSWSIADNPQPGSQRDMLFGAAALSPDDVWGVGDQEGANGIFQTLAEHWNGTAWTVVPTPDPASAGDHLYGVYAVSPDDIWAVGQQLTGSTPDLPLVEHWNGICWSVVNVPGVPSSDVLLDGVTATSDGQVWTVGEADSPAGGGQPLIEHYAPGQGWQVQTLPTVPDQANWSNLYGIATDGTTAYAVGTYVDPATDNNNALVLSSVNGGPWTIVGAPGPGSGSNIPGGITQIDGQFWLAGIYDNGGSELPLIEHHA